MSDNKKSENRLDKYSENVNAQSMCFKDRACCLVSPTCGVTVAYDYTGKEFRSCGC